jgi:hypothetical protein
MSRKKLPGRFMAKIPFRKYLPCLMLGAIQSAWGAAYYVSPGGNDAYTAIQAKNPATPWKTIQKAANTVVGGDSIIVRAGSYNESNIQFSASGSSSKWIYIVNESGTAPDITGTGNYGFQIYGDKNNLFSKTNYFISGLTFHGYLQDGISVSYADFVVIDKVTSYDNGNAGVNTVGSNHILIQDCVLHHNGWKSDGDSGWGDGASVNNREFISGTVKWVSVLRRNILYANRQKRAASYWDGNGFTWDLAGTGGVHLFANNILFNNGGAGMLNDNTGNMVIVHNTLFRNMSDYNRCQNMGELYLTDSYVENTILKNNIIFSRPSTVKYSSLTPIILYNAANGTGEVLQNNLVWGEKGSLTEIYWLKFMSLSSWVSQFAPSTVTGSPGFVSAPFDNAFTTYRGGEWIQMNFQDYNFSLKQDAPCVDKGAFLTVTKSAGSGTQVPVENAKYFTDGFLLKNQGDFVRIGGENYLRILSIDYDNNIITVDKSIRWIQGEKVSLPYYGTAPDIGSNEYMPQYMPHETTPESSEYLFAVVTSKITQKIIGKLLEVKVTANVDVTKVPTPLIMVEADGTRTNIPLDGTVPGKIFTGSILINESIAEGTATFQLEENALISANLATGSDITDGQTLLIHKTPPIAPAGLKMVVLNQ